MRTSESIKKSLKRHFTDLSLAAVLGITNNKLLNALVERDLIIYIESLVKNLFHYRNNKIGLEVDPVVELSDSEYRIIEI